MKTILFPTFLCALLIAFSACSSTPPPKTVTVTSLNTNQTISLLKGDTLKVLLDGNPTTGYTWQRLPSKTGALMQVGEYDFKPTTSALGSPGVFTFIYSAVRPGTDRVELVYERASEKEAPKEAFALNVQVHQD